MMAAFFKLGMIIISDFYSHLLFFCLGPSCGGKNDPSSQYNRKTIEMEQMIDIIEEKRS